MKIWLIRFPDQPSEYQGSPLEDGNRTTNTWLAATWSDEKTAKVLADHLRGDAVPFELVGGEMIEVKESCS